MGARRVRLIPGEYLEQHRETVEREIRNHMDLSVYGHPCIAQLQRVTIMPPSLALIMECGGDITLETLMEQHGGRLPVHMARRVFAQVVLTLDFCRRLGKCNRNVTPACWHVYYENPAPESMEASSSPTEVCVKLSDFCHMKDALADSAPKTKLGIALYTAPEIVISRPGSSYDGAAADVWSCGVLLAMMVFGAHPFIQPDEDAEDLAAAASAAVDTPSGRSAMQLLVKNQMAQLLGNAISGQMTLPAGPALAHPEVVQLLKSMLQPDPANRATTTDILAHPWVSGALRPDWVGLNERLVQAHSHPSSNNPAREVIQTALRMHRQLQQQRVMQVM
uniref:Protein kinase domain-containing protein n=1 Tax=Chlamydomonas leiostraca TaxID=1034604 RepID=A0A7S0WZR7_9CHLO|mmetsp:Transcript_398/g.1038  ORF Transcript_398/g.1038 Transcript_398/m.1038 type:complete len:335 (+) Transcript_398:234-1238(+)|eukprot:CAMPEP_0202859950 /NCGR_PEP_ID=MMETSP1391-20130828/1860_1 /ASSEMBLY_ACC=CAM_ASM_000867 /TAXON_ID=1034604 /ORGANISM="Chlamydomonas leiostraca, Strain SAG 11-49" /LENGTH=334 /DNA_ID=CAMNT_0049539065 /DNA_START=233 /DNA_END=1237 /DNA_ORIENTATION=-